MDNLYDKLEVLCPAGNLESFYSALANGTNAIYLGLSNFNARMKADNFNEENIFEVVKTAHIFGVKIYVTLNTLLSDSDFDEMIELVKVLTNAGVDAFIVQDLGVAHVLKSCFQNIVLHASTQMGVHNLQGAKVLEKLGFSRVVLSRETKLEDIKQIKQNTSLEIEYFVQGALCVSFSGNCYMSAIENNASGNEGKCLQLCRLPYFSSLSNNTKYYLSTRDLSLLENLPLLIDAGVTSFKIEGRLRHAGYVATCANIYSHAIKLIAQNKFSKSFLDDSNTKLMETYSRGEFNKNAYLLDPIANIINPDYQNHIGIKIGRVTNCTKFKNDLYKIEIETKHKISTGDGIKFIDEKTKTQVASLGVGNVISKNEKTIVFCKTNIPKGISVNLTKNAKNEEILLKNTAKIEINLKITAISGKNINIETIANNNTFSFDFDEICEKAKSQPLTETDFVECFSKLAKTPFKLNKLSLITDGIFMPKSLLNKLRILLVEKLENAIISNYPKVQTVFNENQFISIKNVKILSNPENLYIIDENFQNLSPDKLYIFAPSEYSQNSLKIFEKLCRKFKIALFLPNISSSKDFAILDKFIEKCGTEIPLFINNISGLYYAGTKKIIASPLLNIKNQFAIKFLNSFGVSTICASIEADENFVAKYNLIRFGDGLLPLMTFTHCPVQANFDSNCTSCKYQGSFLYKRNNQTYQIKRTKIAHCYFSLCKAVNKKQANWNLINLLD